MYSYMWTVFALRPSKNRSADVLRLSVASNWIVQYFVLFFLVVDS